MIKQLCDQKNNQINKVRVFKETDLGQVKNLIDKTIDTSYAYYPTEFINYWKNNVHSKDSILKDALEGFTLVAELNKEIVGTGTLVGSEILRVFVNPRFQRKGIGKKIMSLLEEHARENGVDAVYLTSTPVSKSFYDSFGYQTIERKIFSEENSQKVGYFRMTKNLKNSG